MSTDAPKSLPLLQALPWFQSSIFDLQNIGQVIHGDSAVSEERGTGVQAVIDKLTAFERGIKSVNQMTRSILRSQPDEMVQCRLAALSKLPTEKLSNLVSILLDYRLLDTLCAIRVGSQPSGQPERLPIPLPPKIFFKSAANWPSMVTQGIKLLREGRHEESASTHSCLNPTATIFTSLVLRKDTIEGHKIMANFECAAAYLSLIFKGITDLPNTVPEFKELVQRVCHDTQPSHERWDGFFSSIKSVHSFKLPLHFALATSIACLFLPTNFMTKDLNRLSLVQMWQGLGGARPAQLQAIELILWEALVEISLGRYPLEARLRSAFREVGNIDLSEVGYPESEWLHADPNFHDLEPSSSSKPQSSHSRTLPLQDANTPRVSVEQAQACQRTTRSAAARLAQAGGVVTSATVTPPDPAYPRTTTTTTTPTKKKKKKPASKRAVSVESNHSDSGMRMTPKRKLSELKLYELHSAKAMKLETGARHIVYETFDLSAEKTSPPIIDLTLEDDPPLPQFATESYRLWNDQTDMNFVAVFYFQREAEWFNSLFRAIQKTDMDCKPPFLANPSCAFFRIVPEAQASSMPAAALQIHMHQAITIVTGSRNGDYRFDENSLRAFAMLNKPVPVTDFSIAPDQDRMAFGTLNQLIQSAEGRGKPLAVTNFPMPNGPSPLSSISSDVYAWDMTIDQPWCGRRWEMPRSDLRWAEILTKNTYRSLGFSPNGFGTQIEVKGGSQLLVICQPAQFNPHNISSVQLLDRIQNIPFLEDWQTLTFQAFHLQPGHTAIIKPMVPFLLLSTSNSIVYKCHFFSTSTLQETCTGFLHSSLALSVHDNPSQKAAQSLLCRMVHYYHLVYLHEGYIENKQRFLHVPDVFEIHGVLNLLALCNLFEIINVVAYTVSELDRHRFIEARRLCRRMVSWLQAHFIFTGNSGERLDVCDDIWLPYLARQIKALGCLQTNLGQRYPTSSLPDIQAKVADCLDHHVVTPYLQQTTEITVDDFSWPSTHGFIVAVRETPGIIADDIRGETLEDLRYFHARQTEA